MALKVPLAEYVGKKVRVELSFAGDSIAREGRVVEVTPKYLRVFTKGKYTQLVANPKRVTSIEEVAA